MEQVSNEVALVEWKQPRPYTINYAKAKDVVAGVRLMPGMNVVPYTEWANVEKHPVLLKDIEDGDVVIHSVKKGNVGDVLTKMNPRDALAMVKETVDRDVLRAWAATEKRSQLKTALDVQIKRVTAVKKEKKDED